MKSGDRDVAVLFICSTSILDYRFATNPSYPGIAEDFDRTFKRLRSLKCDVLLSPHADFFELDRKRALLNRSGSNPFIDPALCRGYIDQQERAFRNAVARQQRASRR